MLPKRAFDSMGRELDPRSGKLKEAHDNAEMIVVSKDMLMRRRLIIKRHAYETWKELERVF